MNIKTRYLIYFGSCESSLLINSPPWRDTECNTQVKAEFFLPCLWRKRAAENNGHYLKKKRL